MSKMKVQVSGVEFGMGDLTVTTMEAEATGLRFQPGPVTGDERRMALASRLEALGLKDAALAVEVAIICNGDIVLVPS
jgi:hypothetical protein